MNVANYCQYYLLVFKYCNYKSSSFVALFIIEKNKLEVHVHEEIEGYMEE